MANRLEKITIVEHEIKIFFSKKKDKEQKRRYDYDLTSSLNSRWSY